MITQAELELRGTEVQNCKTLTKLVQQCARKIAQDTRVPLSVPRQNPNELCELYVLSLALWTGKY